jgi:hypothetical protein
LMLGNGRLAYAMRASGQDEREPILRYGRE